MLTGRIHSFETFGSVDGPGVRFVVFMQGCRMRCKYCHNPDSWKINAGEEKTSDEVLKYALRYRNYWGKDGGITVSGGEPLLQIDFITELFKGAKKEGVHTTIDTAASPFSSCPPCPARRESVSTGISAPRGPLLPDRHCCMTCTGSRRRHCHSISPGFSALTG